MSSELGKEATHARAIFLESLWWFLHRTSGFTLDVNSPPSLKEAFDGFSVAVSETQSIDSSLCPQNMVLASPPRFVYNNAFKFLKYLF